MKEVADRRKTGVHRTMISDGNGGYLDLVTVTANRVKVIAGSAVAVLSLAALVFGAVRVGVSTEVHQQIDESAANENGAIHLQIDRCATQHAAEMQERLDEELEAVEAEIDRVGDLGEDLRTKQEAMSEQIDRNHDEIMRMLRRPAPDGSG